MNALSYQPDWKVDLLGPSIQLNQTDEEHEYTDDDPYGHQYDEEAPSYIPTMDAFDGYEYVALFFGANYCPHCKAFSPTVVQSIHNFERNKCKVIMVSNDRDEANFNETCAKVRGIDMMPYNVTLTRQMRDSFGIQTIPALLIFRIDEPKVISNGRHILLQDRSLSDFPWANSPAASHNSNGPTSKAIGSTLREDNSKLMTVQERFIIQGTHGKWYHRGHKNVIAGSSNETMYMDEHAVRIRAGILNSITWIALMNIFFFQDHTLVKVLFPLVAYEFLSAMLFGLTPLAPIGTYATAMAIALHPTPHWKPANPKRFAWLIGLTLSSGCYLCFSFQDELGGSYRYVIAGIVLTCNIATWLESSAGFCFGCFLYNTWVVRWFPDMEECSECKM